MTSLRQRYPLLFTLGTALIFAVFGFFFFSYAHDSDPYQAALRAGFLAALVLISSDVLEGLEIERNERRVLGRAAPWFFGFYMGLLFWCANILLSWNGNDPILGTAITYGVTSVFFGVAMTVLSKKKDMQILEARYDLENSRTLKNGFNRAVFYVWPFLYTALMFGFILTPPIKALGVHYMLFQFVFLGFLLPLYDRKASEPAQNGIPNLPRYLGMFILVVLVFLAKL